MARRDALGGNLRMSAIVNERNRLGTGRRLIQPLQGEVTGRNLDFGVNQPATGGVTTNPNTQRIIEGGGGRLI